MITKTIELYTIEELKEKYPLGYEKAISDMRSDNDYYFLSESIEERLKDLLSENDITEEGDTKVFYSLSYCQGDGVMFQGDFKWKGNNYAIKHSGHYYHYNSKNIDATDEEGEYIDEQDFNDLYVSICEQLERYGYDYIEAENEESNIVENCIANDYTFESDGKMNNI